MDSESLIPIRNLPNMHSQWSLSFSPIAKNIWPMAHNKESVRSMGRRDSLSIMTARISGGKRDARNLTEKYMLNYASSMPMFIYISVCKGAGPFPTN